MAEVDLDAVLRRAARRDPDALSSLVDLYSPRVYGLLYRLSGSRDVAEDLLQETFLRVVRGIDKYEHSGKFESWLFRIAANLARDRARQQRRRGWTTSLDGDAGENDDLLAIEDAAIGSRLDERIMQRETRERLDECLQRLAEPEREILLLRHFAELPFAEIADVLGIPLGTALARAHRALKRLRAEFGEEE